MTAITTYATLQTRIAEDCNRTDSAFTTAVPGFIQTGEAELRRRVGKTRHAIGRATATINNEYELTPTDYGSPLSFELQSDPKYALTYITPEALSALKGTYSSSGKPIYYTQIGGEFQFLPEPGEGYTGSLTYYRDIAALSASNTTNWLLLKHPDAYLWASLIYAYQWLQDPAEKANAANALDIVLASIETRNLSEAYGASLQSRPTLVV